MKRQSSKSTPAPAAEMGQLAYCKIFPPIGVGRVGDSTLDGESEGWFIGPELPSQEQAKEFIVGPDGKVDQERLQEFSYARRPENFSYKDAVGKIKRQGSRFRIYGFDKSDQPLGEITSEQATITWKVELANKKASWFTFDGTQRAMNVFRGETTMIPKEVRNQRRGKINYDAATKKYTPDETRSKFLDIKGQSSIEGNEVTGGHILKGFFKEKKEVYLGELKTDAKGRLIVLGGRGVSEAIDDNGKNISDLRWIRNYANNNDWYDDISDGPVSAEVILRDSNQSLEVRDGAWVLIAPPDFAPDVKNIVSLYDVMEETAWRNSSLQTPTASAIKTPEQTDFQKDIAPVLDAMHAQRWVNARALKGHGLNKPGDFHDPNDPAKLREELNPASSNDDSPKAKALRARLFEHLRQPAYAFFREGVFEKDQYDQPFAVKQAKTVFMPPLSGDEGDVVDGDPTTWLSLTYLQYERFRRWLDDPYQKSPQPDDRSRWRIEIDHLTHTVMDSCAGGAFFPGIEMTCIARGPMLYSEAFRLATAKLEAGDASKYMALPWQADFWECQQHWWPAQRPDDIIADEDFDEIFKSFREDAGANFEKVLFNRIRWDRGVSPTSRPSGDYLSLRTLPEGPKGITLTEYISLIAGEIPEYSKDGVVHIASNEFDSLAGDFRDKYYRKLGIFNRLLNSVTPEGIPTPWRLQFVFQEALDSYCGLYFTLNIPTPEEAFDKTDPSAFVKKFGLNNIGTNSPKIRTLDDLRNEWSFLSSKNPDLLNDIVKEYNAYVRNFLVTSCKDILTKFVASEEARRNEQSLKAGAGAQGPLTVAEFRQRFEASVSAIEEREYLYSEFSDTSNKYFNIRAVEMFENARDYLYTVSAGFSGDMGMVENWKSLGFVTRREIKWTDPVDASKEFKNSIQYEGERPRYDGRSFRDHFYYLMNIDDHPQYRVYARKLASEILDQAQAIIDDMRIDDRTHPESFVPYTPDGFDAKMEEIYTILQNQAASAQGWRDSRNRESRIRRIYDSAVFNQTDGAWLRRISNTGTIDKVNSLLFEVWSDEIGNGNPYLHHGNLFTNLLQSLGIYLETLNSRKYADNPDLDESSFIGAVFQLAISLHTEAFYPEIIGMTLFLEWEVLSLVAPIKGLEYVGIDSHFWQMHVGIDNATHGHGAKAKEAVKLYLDRVGKEGGNQAVQTEWRRIWRGFVAFATAGNGYFGDDLDVARRHKRNPQGEIVDLIIRKAHYGGLNHSGKHLGGHRLNDLFDEPGIFVEQLANSPYVVPGRPDESKLLSYLTTYEGPMYKVFDEADLKRWASWIEWLNREGETDRPKSFQTKAKAMYLLLQELREVARSVQGHKIHRMGGKVVQENGSDKYTQGKRIFEYFENGQIEELMVEFKTNKNNGWVVPYQPGESALVTELAQGSRPMGKVLDRRFPAIGNQVGRQIIIKWIEAGCPLLEEEDKMPEKELPTKFWNGKQLLVQQMGMGAVH